MKEYQLNNSRTIPAIGLGTWQSRGNSVYNAVLSALKIGYRHIDCAPVYKNQKLVGLAIHDALQKYGINRRELFISSKLWNNAHAPRHVRPAVERSLRELQLDYLDLFLIHWPVRFRQDIEFPRKSEHYLPPDEERLLDTWKAMEKMVKKGLCRSIGVCNFRLSRLNNLLSHCKIPPAVNQIELHPYLRQQDMLEFAAKHHVLLTAYSPLGSPGRPDKIRKGNAPELLDHPVIIKISKEIKASPAQVVLAWGLARQCAVIPKSVNPSRLKENLGAMNISLSRQQIDAITSLDCNNRFLDGSFFCQKFSSYSLDYLW